MKSKPILNVDGEHRAFFGRKMGKRLHTHQRELYDSLLPELEISFSSDTSRFSPVVPFDKLEQPLVLEIGYGGGEHLARQAIENPDKNFIGAEVFSGGIAKMLEKIEEQDIANVRLFTFDAYNLLKDLPDACLEAVYLLYPDPWPKKKHHKRRFVSPLTLAELARVLKPGGAFYFATDIEDYANWTLAHILRSPYFNWEAQAPASWHQPYPGWQPTRYEKKAKEAGRNVSFYFSFCRAG